MISLLLISGALGLSTTLVLIPLALRFDWASLLPRRSVDWHHTQQRPVPRVGGAVLVCAFVLVEFWLAMFYPELRNRTPERNLVILSSVAMFALGFWDDLSPLRPLRKLGLQIVIAGLVCWGGVGIEVWRLPFAGAPIELGLWGPVITITWLVCLTNLINLVDGLDGLAGGISCMLMLLLAAMAHQSGNFELVACGMAGALLGFLRYNLPPARIYLGDGGAYFLGFQVGLYAIVNSHKGTVVAALVGPLFALSLPICDALLTVTRRGLRGLPLFRADRKHLHHRLVANGSSRGRVLLAIYVLNAVFVLMGWGVFWSHGQWTSISAAVVVLLLLICAFTCRFSRPWFALHRVVRGCWCMRGLVRRALFLGRWLEVESRLQSNPSEFWSDLVFAAETLGFASLKLTLQGESRCWRRKGFPAGSARKFAFQGRTCGILELKAPACPLNFSGRGSGCQPNAKCLDRQRPCLADPRVFDTISDLLAEAWNNSATQWQRRNVPLRFGSQKVSYARTLSTTGAEQSLKSTETDSKFGETPALTQLVQRSDS